MFNLAVFSHLGCNEVPYGFLTTRSRTASVYPLSVEHSDTAACVVLQQS